MGRAVEQIAQQRSHIIVDIVKNNNELSELTAKNIDVVIEFTNPLSVLENILFCIKNCLPIVCGTTGWDKHLQEVKKDVEKYNGSLLYSSNFSVGMNILFEINRKLAQLMNVQTNYEATIEEIHHIYKMDSPSGTAITLASDIIEYNKKYNEWATNEQLYSETKLIINSKREGEVPGTHIVQYTSEEDIIKIEHKANNRIGFARGAIVAAEFLYNKKGVYTMKDVVNI